tara:strand:- start:1201 stop:1785 length:585 start_codon:yes stop_codon:yes gene_type:complete
MAYDLKNVFYLDVEQTIAATTAGNTTTQLDLSAYVDSIARGRQKGTGLAIYKVHYSVSDTSEGYKPMSVADTGSFRAGLVAGAGLGTNATGAVTLTGTANSPTANNALAVMGFDWYGAKTTVANASTPGGETFTKTFLEPSKEVPYVVVRDNICVVSTIETNMINVTYISFRLECAQVTLDQATMNQLLRTQTV